MKKTKVKTLVRQVRGVSYKPEDLHNELDDNSVVLLRANNIDDGKINFDDVVYVDKSKVSDEQYLKDGDILICASSGSKNLVGKAASIRFNTECTFGAFCKVIRPKEGLDEYLSVYFQSPIYRRKISEVAIGANINNIRNEHIDELDIPVFSNDEQASIVKKIHLIQEVISNRKAELEKLDNLIKARFVEMFVDRDYPLIALDELSLGKGEYGAQSASIDYNSSRPRYVRITDINDDGTLNDDLVSSANVEDDKQYKLSYGDFMFARMGATVGKAYAYKSGNQIFAGYLIRYRLNLEKIMPEYLYAYTKLDEYRNWVLLNQSGAAQPGINAKKYGSLRVPVAPLKEQKAFVKFVNQVDKSKVAVQKALTETQLLFDSLMQQYFG